MVASDSEGVAHVKVSAVSGSYKAAETIALEVRNPNPEVTTVKHFSLEKGQSREVSGTSLQLAAFPAIDVRALYLNMKNLRYKFCI